MTYKIYVHLRVDTGLQDITTVFQLLWDTSTKVSQPYAALCQQGMQQPGTFVGCRLLQLVQPYAGTRFLASFST